MNLNVSIKTVLCAAALAILTGCAAVVPMAPEEQSKMSKAFNAPAPGMASVYIYRNSSFGKALTKRVSIDGTAIGETGPWVFFHREVTPGKHVLTTEAEFGENSAELTAEAGKIYFYRQYIKMGVFKGGAGIEAVSEEDGKKGVAQCKEAK